MCAGHITKGFEEVHSKGVATDPGAADKFRENIQGNVNTGDGADDADGNYEDEAEGYAVEYCADRCLQVSGT